jgi:alpha-L-fucosidase 2
MLTASPATEPRQRVVRAGTLWYDQPAERWFSAQPVGNGRLGGMVYGGVPAERIDLSESTVWSGGPSPSTDLSPTAREQEPITISAS